MLVIVGHGPGVLRASGEWIDQQTVVRLKHAPRPLPCFGTRTDYLCGTGLQWRTRFDGSPQFWLFDPDRHYERIERLGKGSTDDVFFANTPHWLEYFAQFKPEKAKPSVGLCAVFCAVELGHTELALVGFDSFTTDNTRTGKWHDARPERWVHDQRAEREALEGLGILFHHI
jgi:hypothetical protein